MDKPGYKNQALRAIRSTGSFWVARHLPVRRRKLLILCYHGIETSDETRWAGHLFITQERFRERLACLRRLAAEVLPLGEAVVRLKAGSLPPRSVAITFDDGFQDFWTRALPVLSEFQYPSTLYLTTHYVNRPYPIYTLALNYLLWKSGLRGAAFPEQGIAEERPLGNWQQRASIVHELAQWMDAQAMNSDRRNAMVELIAGRLGVDYQTILRTRMLQLMSADEVSSAARAGVDIQMHTHRHRTPRQHDLFVREIEDNREAIRRITGKAPMHFCYPSGVHAAEFLPWLRQCGVPSATTCERGYAKRDSQPLLLPRLLDDSNMDLVQFEAFVSGFWI